MIIDPDHGARKAGRLLRGSRANVDLAKLAREFTCRIKT